MTYDKTSSGGTVGTDMESGHTYTFANASDVASAGMGNTGGGTGFKIDIDGTENVGMASTHYGRHYEVTGTVTETAGVSAIAHAHISEHDFEMQGGASVGASVGVGYKAGVHGEGVRISTQDGVSIGPQLAVNGNCSFKFTDNKLQIAAAGKLACEIGVHGSFKICIDCAPLEHDAKVVASHLVHSYDVVGNDVVETGVVSVANAIASGVTKEVNDIPGDVTIASHDVTHDVDELGHDLGIGHISDPF